MLAAYAAYLGILSPKTFIVKPIICFETGSLYIVLAGMELVRLALNLQ